MSLKLFLIIFIYINTSLMAKKTVTRRNSVKPSVYKDFRLLLDGFDKKKKKKSKKNTVNRDLVAFGRDVKDMFNKRYTNIFGIPFLTQALPILYPSRSTGFNIGGRLSLFDMSRYDPYRFHLNLQLWFSDRGKQNHEIKLIFPHFLFNKLYVKFHFKYPKIIDKKYFGIGNDSLFNKNLIDKDSEDFISRVFYQYIYLYPSFTTDIRYSINKNFKVYTGVGFDKATITPYYENSDSYIFSQRPYGYTGGKTNYIKIGLMFDNRNEDVSPLNGFLISATYTAHNDFIGSDYNYSSTAFSLSYFYSFWRYFTFANRFISSHINGNAPFFVLSRFSTHENIEGFGGKDTLRGAEQYRYIGKLKAINQFELRTRFYHGVLGRKTLVRVDFVPFIDVGRVWNSYKEFSFKNLHYSYGSSLRLAINKRFIVNITMAKSKDSFSTYLSFGELFK